MPMTPHGKVVIIRQYRHGIGEVALEIPGGVVDEEDESLAAAAGRLRHSLVIVAFHLLEIYRT